MIQNSITKLIQYGLETGLIEKEDTRYAANKVLELLKIDSLDEDAEQAMADYVPGSSEVVGELECILGEICDYAYENGILEENTVGYRDLFDTKVMALLVDRPSNIIRKFQISSTASKDRH